MSVRAARAARVVREARVPKSVAAMTMYVQRAIFNEKENLAVYFVTMKCTYRFLFTVSRMTTTTAVPVGRARARAPGGREFSAKTQSQAHSNSRLDLVKLKVVVLIAVLDSRFAARSIT